MTPSSLVAAVGTHNAGDGDYKTGQEDDGHDRESEGPLECDDLGKELTVT